MTDSVVAAERQAAFSRSEEDDSDDSGVIRDVSKRRSVDGRASEVRSSEESARPGSGDMSPSKHSRDAESAASESAENVTFSVGDLVWARTPTTTFYPCVVTPDPHFKFHTKIVKSDPGHHAGKSPNGAEAGQRQYHVHYLGGENRRVWLQRNLIIPFRGLAAYEKLAMEDLQNIHKIYKPKTEASKAIWREGVLKAQEMEELSNRERVAKCDLARMMERGGDKEKVLQKKLEFEKQRKLSESDRSPEKFKSPTSPRKSIDSDEKKKSIQYNRKDELAYKMSKMSKVSKNNDEKRKRKSDEDKKAEETKPSIPFNVFDASTTPTFVSNRSFKIKSIAKPVEEQTESDNCDDDLKRESCNTDPRQDDAETSVGVNGTSVESTSPKRKESTEDEAGEDDTSVAMDVSLTEGSLVWAKQRGYPYWPAVIARDPKDGEFVKCPLSDSNNSQFKSQRKMHVLFLEYNNQRAWLPSSALHCYTSKAQFEEEAAKAGPNRKKDFAPGKRYQAQFDRAVEFSETLSKLPDEDRLEAVFHKYGWVMVTEPDHVAAGDAGGPKSKKRKLITDCEEDLVKSTDSEADTQGGGAGDSAGAMHRLASADRRSSADAETRLDPGVDSQDGDTDASKLSIPPTTVVKKKRESSLVAAIAMNGDSSSDENISDSERKVGNSKKKRKSLLSSDQTPKNNPKSQGTNSPAPATAVLRLNDDEFPRLGDLVWGRMSGFPFWPSFITKSPQGQYKKVGANGKANYHVQFFNWNDESGWVNAALEFDGLDSFKKIAAKKKSDKSYNPAKGAMYNKWERAARDAEETMDLTRSERLDCYLVTYGANQMKKVPPKPSPSPRNSKPSTPKPKKAASTAASPQVSTPTGGGSKARRRPGPASRTGLTASPTRATGGQMPAGWRIKERQEGGHTFISPDGREFQDKSAALRYISTCVSQSGVSNVQYLTDTTLPSGWKCQKMEDSIYYFSPRGERFDTREGVAARLEEEGAEPELVARVRRGGMKRRIGPKSVLRKIGYEVLSDESDRDSSTSEDEDPEHILRLPNKLKFRKGGRMDEYLDVDKIFDPSNGGMIEMVQLPDIFLGHPTVRVTESDNEMVISDVDTGEFIAKKIIYD